MGALFLSAAATSVSQDCREKFYVFAICAHQAAEQDKTHSRFKALLHQCYEDARTKEDKLECDFDAMDVYGNECPSQRDAFENCVHSFEFEDFVLGLAEELESPASAYGLRGSSIEEE